jgi:hypothetical protein
MANYVMMYLNNLTNTMPKCSFKGCLGCQECSAAIITIKTAQKVFEQRKTQKNELEKLEYESDSNLFCSKCKVNIVDSNHLCYDCKLFE